MISPSSRRRRVLVAAAAFAAIALPSQPALAIAGFDMSAGLYAAYDLTTGGGFGADLDAFVGTPVLKLSGHMLTVSGQTIGEASLRFEPLPIPILALRPGIGYQGLLPSGGSLTHALYPSLAVSLGIPLVPVSADVEVGAGIPTTMQPLICYAANVNIFPIPLLPLAISARYRGYQGVTPMPSTVEGGLRVAL